MPTHEELPSFLRGYQRLRDDQRQAFRRAVELFVEGLKSGQMPAKLRVKAVEGGPPGVRELTWAPDGRATFSYGEEKQPGDPHIIWRRIGTHSIFREP